MGLERMELSCFKTYRQEANIVFSEFTCVVGPNGAGKSNLVDALAFVLGAELSEIRGSVAGRGTTGPVSVAVQYRSKKGNLVWLKREIRNEISVYSIDDTRVSAVEYMKYLGEEGVSVKHRNFLISQNESMIKLPRELTKLIDEISGSSQYKESYKISKTAKETAQKELHEVNEKKRSAEVNLKESKETEEMVARYKQVFTKKSQMVRARLMKRKQSIVQAKAEMTQKINVLRAEHQLGQVEQTEVLMAQLQTQIIKARAERTALQAQQRSAVREQDEARDRALQEINRLKKKQDLLLERKSEAASQIEECLWQLKKINEVVPEKNPWADKLHKETLIKTIVQLQQLEEEKDVSDQKIKILEIEKKIKESEADCNEGSTEIYEEKESERLAELNKELHATLQVLSGHSAYQRESAHTSRLAYYIEQLKQKMPQIIGKLEDLVSVKDPKYQVALQALIASKKNILIVDGEKSVLPILNGLSNAGCGRVTILPLSRITATFPPGSTAPSEEYARFTDLITLSPQVPQPEQLAAYICGSALVYLGEGVPEIANVKVVTLDGIVVSTTGTVRRIAQIGRSEVRGLEEKRDRLLAEIREESTKLRAFQKENQPRIQISPALAQLHTELAQLKEDLAESLQDIKARRDQIIAASQLDPVLIQQALKQGVVDSKSAQRKQETIYKKKEAWQHNLQTIQGSLDQVLLQIQEKQATLPAAQPLVQPDCLPHITAIDQRIEALEQELVVLANQLDSPQAIEMKIIQEQLLALTDEYEEIDQYIAEEGIAQENGSVLTEMPCSDDDIEKAERELTSIKAFLKDKVANLETEDHYQTLVQEAERARLHFADLQKQHNDIKKERTSLFLSIFDRLNESFNRHYTQLTATTTEHVKAHLGLETPQEPYAGGTTAYVMPTGKTFREAKYLSGGEKTMAALSLLLSIHEIYPSPFYIFDELDAALDKDKITSLRESLQIINAQFIAVTHRLELFEKAATLIGIAKPPQGHSQVFTLKL
ncbi:structural maintenance of chromosome 1 [Nematocida homosporus]|uniref:structural maintenance of chromosome 1 n=1 Tax=Nematocida homosporus TaxID=1912981 RepID=UPI00221E9590|nr:structural maintenance of chromosome 1 [Nematocida homosporus]KAI5186822.1 structural maintenance of chromosome 1 [Nematocida homosporus]